MALSINKQSHVSNFVDDCNKKIDRLNFQFGKKKSFKIEDINPEQTKKYLSLCACSCASFNSDSLWLEGSGYQFIHANELNVELMKGVSKSNFSLIDPKTGLKMNVLVDEKNSNNFVVAFGAVGSLVEHVPAKKSAKVSFQQRFTAIKCLLGIKPKLYKEALKQFQELQKAHPTAQFHLVGNSLGASLASYVSLKTETPSTCFNAIPLGVGLQWSVGRDKLQNAERYVTHVSAKSDTFSDPSSTIKKMDRVLNFIRIKTPGIFGTRHRIPTAYKDAASTHGFIMGSVMNHLGFDIRDRPIEFFRSPQNT